MRDSYGRNLHYLRVSVTDRCNLRCRYCMPEEGIQSVPHTAVLSFDEILRLVRIMAGLGVNRVRLTGGEPLVRKGLHQLAKAIKQIDGVDFLGLTTNGVLLGDMAGALRAGEVDGLNISIDTLDKQRYAQLTRRNELDRVLENLHKVLDMGFPSVKVNCVLAPQSIPQDWLGVASLAQTLAVDVRFIEWMPMAGEQAVAVQSGQVLDALKQRYGALSPLGRVRGSGPADYWHIEGFKGRVGIIHAMSHNFCDSCNRLRLTATGDLKLCLFYDTGVALKPLLRGGADDAAITEAILEAVANKPKQHAGRVMAGEAGGACSTIDHAHGMYKTGG